MVCLSASCVSAAACCVVKTLLKGWGLSWCFGLSWVMWEPHTTFPSDFPTTEQGGKAPAAEIRRHSNWECESLEVFGGFLCWFSLFFLLFLQPDVEDVFHNILLQSFHHHETDRKQVRQWMSLNNLHSKFSKHKQDTDNSFVLFLLYEIKFGFQWSNLAWKKAANLALCL